MRINWPFVNRRRYNNLLWQFNEAKLTAHVAETTIQHLMDCRLDHVKKMAMAALEIARLKKEISKHERDLTIAGLPT